MMNLMMIQTFRKLDPRPACPLLEQFAIANLKDSHISEVPRLAIL
jgi:hypothetical protein